MSTPLEDHGGIVPSSDHPMYLPDSPNSILLFVHSTTSVLSKPFYDSLQLNRVSLVYIVLSNYDTSLTLPELHPSIKFIQLEGTVLDFVKDTCISKELSNILFYEAHSMDPIDPILWTLLETATYSNSIEYKDSKGQLQTLWSIGQGGVAPLQHISTLVDSKPVYERSYTTLSEIVVDVSASYTPLCYLATSYNTDKSPYNLLTHRHPYTPIYDMFLRPFQLQPTLKFGEVGVLNGASIHMWRTYFPNAVLHAFDIMIQSLLHVKNIPNVITHLVDETDVHGIVPWLAEATSDGALFDILLEDASHRLDHQLHFLKDAIHYVRPGGLLIIEDIFRAIPITRFQEALYAVSEKVHNAILVRPEHIYRASRGWENDRILLVWVK